MDNIFITLLTYLEVKHTKIFANKCFEEHPYKYTLHGLSDLLSRYNIDNAGYDLNSKEQLTKLATPFVAQIGNDFAVVTTIQFDRVTYIWQDKKITLPTDKFKDHWSGIVLLAEKTEKSAEPEYKKHQNEKRIANTKKSLLAALIILLASNVIYSSLNIDLLPRIMLLTTNTLGLYISYLLLLKQTDAQSSSVDKLCSVFNDGGCNDILALSVAKLWGIISWSEIGFSYFFGNIIVIILFPSLLEYIVLLNIFTLPYTLWSIWYQGFKAKHWCAMCLIIQVLLWLIFIIGCFFGLLKSTSIIESNVIITACLFTIPLLLLNLILPTYTAAKKVSTLTYQTNSIKLKEEVFLTLIKKQPHYDVTKNTSAIQFGNPEANILVTILTNPHCNPCAKMHKRIEALLKEVDDKICFQYIFSSFNDELESSGRFLTSLYKSHQNDSEFIKNAFNKWFLDGAKNRQQFFKEYNENTNNFDGNNEYEKHKRWYGITKLQVTPTILVNGYELPDIYVIEDLKYFIEIDC